MSNHNGGDQLARGGIKATFPASEGGMAEDKWRIAFDDFDPEKFLEAEREKEDRRLYARAEADRDASLIVGEIVVNVAS
jgi:hypothetical protein